MAKKNEILAAGLNGLLNAPAPVKQAAPERPEPLTESGGKSKTVCYYLDADLIEKIKYIAYWDRRKLNAVVSDALREYADKWKPAAEPLKKI